MKIGSALRGSLPYILSSSNRASRSVRHSSVRGGGGGGGGRGGGGLPFSSRGCWAILKGDMVGFSASF